MKKQLLATVGVLAMAIALPSCGTYRWIMGPPKSEAGAATPKSVKAKPGKVPSTAQAEAFVAKAEEELAAESEFAARTAWVRSTYITHDTNWLNAREDAKSTDLAVSYAKGAARFDATEVDAVTRRKLDLLKKAIVLPAPERPGASTALADINSKLSTIYATSKVTIRGKTLGLDDLDDMLRTARDPALTREIWEKWHSTAVPMRESYPRLVTLANEGAQELGYRDAGALWRSWYDMEPDAFARKTDALWSQVKPFYDNLHCYVRAQLNKRYGERVQPAIGPIRADLLGNMWAQAWGNVYDIVAPKNLHLGYDLTLELVAHKYDTMRMFKTAENFYTSLGFDQLPATFWERSMLTRPRDREVVCHASAWNVDDKQDIRIKMCTRINADDFFTVHHEMGHNIYQRAYADQPFLFKGGANDGFHEAIGDFAGLNALTPSYLKAINLIGSEPGAGADIPYLLRIALDKIAFLPFGLLIDKWRWGVFSGEIKPEDYNKAWWELRTKYQGVMPPGERPADAFDPGAKNHIATSVPYMRYFLADIYEFQFYRAACRQAGWKGALNRCTVYGNKDVGARFDAMLKMGQSRPWPEALEAFTGEKDIDASAIGEYFAPLNDWLTEQNKGRQCGW